MVYILAGTVVQPERRNPYASEQVLGSNNSLDPTVNVNMDTAIWGEYNAYQASRSVASLTVSAVSTKVESSTLDSLGGRSLRSKDGGPASLSSVLLAPSSTRDALDVMPDDSTPTDVFASS